MRESASMRTSCCGEIASDMRGEILIIIFYAPTNCDTLSGDLQVVCIGSLSPRRGAQRATQHIWVPRGEAELLGNRMYGRRQGYARRHWPYGTPVAARRFRSDARGVGSLCRQGI